MRATIDERFAGIHLPTLGLILVAMGALVLLAELVRVRARTGALTR